MFLAFLKNAEMDERAVAEALDGLERLHSLPGMTYVRRDYVRPGIGLLVLTPEGRFRHDKLYIDERRGIALALQGYATCDTGWASPPALADRYLAEGDEFVRSLDGAFNILILDDATHTAKVFNDIYALNKFYYREHARGVCMASNIKSVLMLSQSLGLPMPAVRPQGLFQLCWFGWHFHDATLFDGVKCLRHASRLEHNGRTNVTTYWQPEFSDRHIRSRGELVQEFREAIQSVVSKRFHAVTRDVGEIGISLSGGLDSRAIAAAAVNRGLRPQTYTYGAPQTADATIGPQVAQALGLRNIRIQLDAYDISFGARFANWLTEGECTGIGPVYHQRLIEAGIKYKVSGIWGAWVYFGRNVQPYMLKPISQARRLDQVFHAGHVARLNQAEMRRIFSKDTFDARFHKMRATFVESFEDVPPQRTFYKRYQLWEAAHLKPRTSASNQVDQYYFCLIAPFLAKEMVSLWMRMPLHLQLLQNGFNRAVVELNSRVAGLPYALTAKPMRGSWLHDAMIFGAHYLRSRANAIRHRWYVHPGKEVLDMRAMIAQDAALRRTIEQFLQADNFPEDVLDRAGIRQVLAEHCSGHANHTALIVYLLNVAIFFEYLVNFRGELPSEVSDFASALASGAPV